MFRICGNESPIRPLVYLNSLLKSHAAPKLNWNEAEYRKQLPRSRTPAQHADLIIKQKPFDREVLERALNFIKSQNQI